MIVHLRDVESRQPVVDPSRFGLITGSAIAAALVAGLVAAVIGPVAVIVAVGVALFGLVAWRPVLATYLYLATLPFVAGIERGSLLPLVRPNEALLAVLIAGAMAGGYVRAVTGATPLRLRLHPVDVPLAGFFLLATVWPISSMMLRGVTPVAADLAAILPACKLAGLFLLVRGTIRTPTQVLWCIRLIIGGAVGIAAIAVLQTLSVGPIVDLLAIYWPTDIDRIDARGTATLSNALATGDYILIGLTLLVTSAARELLGRWARVGAGLVLAAGLLAAGQVSIWLAALLVGVLLVRRVPGAGVSALRLAPIAGIAVVFGAPALLGRIDDFSGVAAPQSWQVRWDNLNRFYLPELLEHGGFFVGVSPNSVVVPRDHFVDIVYLESGYLQLLWVGGILLLAAFVVLSHAVLTLTRELACRSDGVGACAVALAIAWWMVMFLSLFDAHLFMRGPGDLIFTLVGIVAASAAQERADDAPD